MDDLERIPPETIQKLAQRIFKKIPELGENWDSVYVGKGALQNLTDEEFIILWSLPAIVIKVSKNTGIYIQERKSLLGLRANEHSNIRMEEKQSPRKPDLDAWDEAFGS